MNEGGHETGRAIVEEPAWFIWEQMSQAAMLDWGW